MPINECRWRKCDDIPTQRERLRCGVVKRKRRREGNGGSFVIEEEVVVVGGRFNGPLDTVEIFSVADGKWRKGNKRLSCIFPSVEDTRLQRAF